MSTGKKIIYCLSVFVLVFVLVFVASYTMLDYSYNKGYKEGWRKAHIAYYFAPEDINHYKEMELSVLTDYERGYNDGFNYCLAKRETKEK